MDFGKGGETSGRYKEPWESHVGQVGEKGHGNAQAVEEVVNVGECGQCDGQSKLFAHFK